MSKPQIIILWVGVSSVVIFIMMATFYKANSYSSFNNEFTKNVIIKQSTIKPNPDIVIIGNSLVALGFPGGADLTSKLKLHFNAKQFQRLTVLSASSYELESLLSLALDQTPQIILIDITQWILSSDIQTSLELTHHRYWLENQFRYIFNLDIYRYNQSVKSEIGSLNNNSTNNVEKFKKFSPRLHKLSPQLQSKLLQKNIKIFTYYPNWSTTAESIFGIQNQLKLKQNAVDLTQKLNATLLASPASLPPSFYSDNIHVNSKGRTVYMEWLKAELGKQL